MILMIPGQRAPLNFIVRPNKYMEFQVLQLVVPSLLTVIGWLIAAWWAIEQVKVAHENNARLQRDLLNESHRREIARELINIYKSTTQNISSLKQATFSFLLNHNLENGVDIDGVKVVAGALIEPINESYSKTAQEFTRLDMWLKVTGEHVPDCTLLHEAISDFRHAFTLEGEKAKAKGNDLWTKYQGFLVVYQSNTKIAEDKLFAISKE